MKMCPGCKILKSREEFGPNRSKKDGLQSECRLCVRLRAARYRADPEKGVKERMAKWRSDNAEVLRERAAQRYAKNGDRVRARVALWRAANPERKRELDALSYAKNREKRKKRSVERDAKNREKSNARKSQWRKNHPDKCALLASARRGWLARACPLWADHEAIAAIYRMRDRMTEESGVQHHVDHIIPLKSKFVCGLHVHNNLQVMPAVENISKRNSFTPG